jgi:hypothetical protein
MASAIANRWTNFDLQKNLEHRKKRLGQRLPVGVVPEEVAVP